MPWKLLLFSLCTHWMYVRVRVPKSVCRFYLFVQLYQFKPEFCSKTFFPTINIISHIVIFGVRMPFSLHTPLFYEMVNWCSVGLKIFSLSEFLLWLIIFHFLCFCTKHHKINYLTNRKRKRKKIQKHENRWTKDDSQLLGVYLIACILN